MKKVKNLTKVLAVTASAAILATSVMATSPVFRPASNNITTLTPMLPAAHMEAGAELPNPQLANNNAAGIFWANDLANEHGAVPATIANSNASTSVNGNNFWGNLKDGLGVSKGTYGYYQYKIGGSSTLLAADAVDLAFAAMKGDSEVSVTGANGSPVQIEAWVPGTDAAITAVAAVPVGPAVSPVINTAVGNSIAVPASVTKPTDLIQVYGTGTTSYYVSAGIVSFQNKPASAMGVKDDIYYVYGTNLVPIASVKFVDNATSVKVDMPTGSGDSAGALLVTQKVDAFATTTRAPLIAVPAIAAQTGVKTGSWVALKSAELDSIDSTFALTAANQVINFRVKFADYGEYTIQSQLQNQANDKAYTDVASFKVKVAYPGSYDIEPHERKNSTSTAKEVTADYFVLADADKAYTVDFLTTWADAPAGLTAKYVFSLAEAPVNPDFSVSGNGSDFTFNYINETQSFAYNPLVAQDGANRNETGFTVAGLTKGVYKFNVSLVSTNTQDGVNGVTLATQVVTFDVGGVGVTSSTSSTSSVSTSSVAPVAPVAPVTTTTNPKTGAAAPIAAAVVLATAGSALLISKKRK